MRTPDKSSCSMAFALTYGQQTHPSQRGIPSSSLGDAPSASGAGASKDPFVGSVFGGRYELERRLASGAMGVVYQARHITLGSTVAVKVLHEHCANDSATALRFEREAEAQAQLDHPNCVRVFDAGVTASGTKYLVMPLLAGAELRELMGGPMDIQRTVMLCLQLLEGLDHAHSRGFIHRDIKPENIFVVLGEDGGELAKLVDFGLVKAVSADASRPPLTEVGKVFGTPWYMSPEQAVGDPISPRSDLYSLGAMMFEMLAGAPPFDAESITVLLHKQLLADVPPLPLRVPASLAACVYRLLEKDPEARYPNARAAADALRAALAGPNVTPAPAGPVWVGAPTFTDERQDSVLKAERVQGRVLALASGLVALAVLFVALFSMGLGGRFAPVAAAEERSAGTPPATMSLIAVQPLPTAMPPRKASSTPAKRRPNRSQRGKRPSAPKPSPGASGTRRSSPMSAPRPRKLSASMPPRGY